MTQELTKITGTVTSVEQLFSLAEMKKSVTVCPMGRLPAAVVINWQGSALIRCIRRGDIKVYDKKPKKDESGYVL